MTKSKDRPILFSAPMVRAMLAGSKTQTRRAFSAHMIKTMGYAAEAGEVSRFMDEGSMEPNDASYVLGFCPYGQPGDRLWVRETTRMRYLPNILTGDPTTAECGEYEADGAPMLNEDEFYYAWWYSRKTCPAIHMPRWASRLTLEIVSVRVERLQDISFEDAIAEGAINLAAIPPFPHTTETIEQFARRRSVPQRYFAELWESINGAGSWTVNPWVWAVEFKKVS